MPPKRKSASTGILEEVLKPSQELLNANLSAKQRIDCLTRIRKATVDVDFLEISGKLYEKDLFTLYTVKTFVDDIWTNLGTDFSVQMESIIDRLGDISHHLGEFIVSALTIQPSLKGSGSIRIRWDDLFKAIGLYFATLESVEKTGQSAYGGNENGR